MTDESFLVFGLGNSGPEYAGNRHNVGHMVLSELAHRSSLSFRAHKGVALVAQGKSIDGPRFILGKSMGFMNTSGGPVSALMKYFDISPERLIVVHDELDLPFGQLRLKASGGHGGHNGIRDIIAALGTNEFMRVRFGIGRPPGRMQAADYVLRDFASAERVDLPVALGDAADAVEMIMESGLQQAQQRFNPSAAGREAGDAEREPGARHHG